MPMTLLRLVLAGETAGFVWNGECFGHHPEFVLEGRVTLVRVTVVIHHCPIFLHFST